MYFFVRFTGYVMVIMGVVFLLAGMGWAIYGFIDYQALFVRINESLTASQSIWRLGDPYMIRFVTSVSGLFVFVTGMFVSAIGQLLLVFADLANHARETNILLRSLRRRPVASLPRVSSYEADRPVG